VDRPDCIRHWSDLEQADDAHYPDDAELLSIGRRSASGSA